MREPLPVDLGLDERGHEVVAGVLLAVLGQLGGELGQRPQRRAQHLDRLAIAEAVGVGGHDQRVGGLHHAVAVRLRHPEHVRDRLQRQALGDEVHEVPAAGGRRLGDDPLGVDPDPVLDPLDLARGERGRDQPAQLGVARRVHGQKRLGGLEHLRRRVGELDALGRAEGRRVARDAADVLVAHDRPVVQPALLGQAEDVLGRLVARDRL